MGIVKYILRLPVRGLYKLMLAEEWLLDKASSACVIAYNWTDSAIGRFLKWLELPDDPDKW